MRVKETEQIAINIVHVVDLIELLNKNSLNIQGGMLGAMLRGQILLAERATNNILEILDKED